MSRERSRGQPGTIEIGPVEPREWNVPGSHDGFAGEHCDRSFTRIARVSKFIREHVHLDRFIFEEIRVRTFRVMSSFVFASTRGILVPLDDQLVNLLQANAIAKKR